MFDNSEVLKGGYEATTIECGDHYHSTVKDQYGKPLYPFGHFATVEEAQADLETPEYVSRANKLITVYERDGMDGLQMLMLGEMLGLDLDFVLDSAAG